jgi:hypothetical protein
LHSFRKGSTFRKIRELNKFPLIIKGGKICKMERAFWAQGRHIFNKILAGFE